MNLQQNVEKIKMVQFFASRVYCGSLTTACYFVFRTLVLCRNPIKSLHMSENRNGNYAINSVVKVIM